jgi:hypothetical protein
MGYTQATAMAEMSISLTESVTWQLRNNHFPPAPSEMIPVAVKAVELCREGAYEKTLKTPFEHRVHCWKVPAHVIVDCYHLEPWCY